MGCSAQGTGMLMLLWNIHSGVILVSFLEYTIILLYDYFSMYMFLMQLIQERHKTHQKKIVCGGVTHAIVMAAGKLKF